MHQSFRRIVAALTIAASLAFPAGAFAASTGGSTPEQLVVASTISATFPAATSYSNGGNGVFAPDADFYSTPEGFVTIVGSNNATGVTITAQAAVYDGPGAIEVGTDKRQGIVSGYSGVGSGAELTPTAGSLPAGTFATAATVVPIASSTGPVAGRQVGINWGVLRAEFSVAGQYDSSIAYVAQTNP